MDQEPAIYTIIEQHQHVGREQHTICQHPLTTRVQQADLPGAEDNSSNYVVFKLPKLALVAWRE